ncbi:MAG: SusD/RagB family nutrient-binding outer membrane lipoprotein [Segetibacter sp.]
MKIKSLIIIAVITLFTAGCKKDYLNVNKDPNNISITILPSLIFTNALNQTVTNMVAQNEQGSYFAGQWTQSSSYIYQQNRFAYKFTNGDFNFFDPIYDNLADYQYVIDNADANKQPFFKGPARIMKAMLYQQLVDLYGNVPFTEALKGLGNLTPKFDDQKAIYEALIPLLDSGIEDSKKFTFAGSFAGSFAGADISRAGNLGGGNTTKWVKFANSLKMRILIRQSRISGRSAYIIPQIQKIIAEGSGFLGVGEDFGINPGFLASDGKQNPLYDRFAYASDGSTRALARFPRPTKFLFDELIKTNDTFRLKRKAYAIGGENPSTPGVSKRLEIIANYRGVPFGVGSGFTAPSTSYIGPSVFVKGEFNRPLYLMIAAESQLLLSEASFLYPSITFARTPQQYYEQGVREAFRLDGATDAQATILLKSGLPLADYTASPNKLQAIWEQKWLAFTNYLGQEAWSEQRRTNFPPIPLSLGAPVGSQPAIRLFYPNTELGSNGANVLAQGTIDIFTSRIFWDID